MKKWICLLILSLLLTFLQLEIKAYGSDPRSEWMNGPLQEWTTKNIDRLRTNESDLYTLLNNLEDASQGQKAKYPIMYAYLMALYESKIKLNDPESLKWLNTGYGLAQNQKDYIAQHMFIEEYTNLYLNYNDVTNLLKYSDEMMKVYEATEVVEDQIESYLTLAWAYFSLGDEESLMKALNKVTLLLPTARHKTPNLDYYLITARTYYSIRSNELARQQFLALSDQAQRIGRKDDPIYFLNQCAQVYILLIDVEMGISESESITRYNELEDKLSKSIFYQSDWELFLLNARVQIAKAYDNNQDIITYGKTYIEQESQRTFLPNYRLGSNLIRVDMGNAYYEIGNYTKASEYYKSVISTLNPKFEMDQWTALMTSIQTEARKDLETEIDLLTQLKDSNAEKIKSQENNIKLMASVMGLLFLTITLLILQYIRTHRLKNLIYNQSIIDSLTRILNRGRILEILKDLDARKTSYAISMIDIDNFKSVNDCYGHVVGDEVLIKIAETIRLNIRESDIIGRYGGEEFILVIGSKDAEIIAQVCERIRLLIETLEWPYEGLKTTISIGTLYAPDLVFEKVIEGADHLLYEAKKSGKNKVVMKMS